MAFIKNSIEQDKLSQFVVNKVDLYNSLGKFTIGTVFKIIEKTSPNYWKLEDHEGNTISSVDSKELIPLYDIDKLFNPIKHENW